MFQMGNETEIKIAEQHTPFSFLSPLNIDSIGIDLNIGSLGTISNDLEPSLVKGGQSV